VPPGCNPPKVWQKDPNTGQLVCKHCDCKAGLAPNDAYDACYKCEDNKYRTVSDCYEHKC
jgi:hypothetical protein